MKERQFAGMLNSKSMYGQSYGDYECFRIHKLNLIANFSGTYNRLRFKWYKKHRYPKLYFAPSLWNYDGEISWSQRQENQGRKKKKFEMFRWRVKND